jgi:hypothetical protein
MKDDMMQAIKERLLDELIDKMSNADPRMSPEKGLGVEVQAKDPASLKEGLDHAKDVVDQVPAHSPDDDEERMLELLANDDEDEGKY